MRNKKTDPNIDILTQEIASLKLEQINLADRITTAESRLQNITRTPITKSKQLLKLGDIVRINSRIILPRKVTEDDRIGEIIKITKKRVQIKTRRNTHTYRDPASVTKLQDKSNDRSQN